MRCSAYTLRGKRCSRQATCGSRCTQHDQMRVAKGGRDAYSTCCGLSAREWRCLYQQCPWWLVPKENADETKAPAPAPAFSPASAQEHFATFAEFNLRHHLGSSRVIYGLVTEDPTSKDLKIDVARRMPQAALAGLSSFAGSVLPDTANIDALAKGNGKTVLFSVVPRAQYLLGQNCRYYAPLGTDIYLACGIARKMKQVLTFIYLSDSGVWVIRPNPNALLSPTDQLFKSIDKIGNELAIRLAAPDQAALLAMAARLYPTATDANRLTLIKDTDEYIKEFRSVLKRYVSIAFFGFKFQLAHPRAPPSPLAEAPLRANAQRFYEDISA